MESLAECDYILGSPLYDLTEDPIQAFNKNGADGWGSEVIWQTACNNISGAYGRMETIYGRSHFSSKNMAAWASQAMSHWSMKQVGWMSADLSETAEARSDKRYVQVYARNDVDPRSNLVPPMYGATNGSGLSDQVGLTDRSFAWQKCTSPLNYPVQ